MIIQRFLVKKIALRIQKDRPRYSIGLKWLSFRLFFLFFYFKKIMDIYLDSDTMESGFDDRARYIFQIITFRKQHIYIYWVWRRIFLNSSEDIFDQKSLNNQNSIIRNWIKWTIYVKLIWNHEKSPTSTNERAKRRSVWSETDIWNQISL